MTHQEGYPLPKTGRSDVVLDILVGSKEIHNLAKKHTEDLLPRKKTEQLASIIEKSSSKEIRILAEKAIEIIKKRPADVPISKEKGMLIYKEICISMAPQLTF